jgi:6-phosphogluconolactonase
VERKPQFPFTIVLDYPYSPGPIVRNGERVRRKRMKFRIFGRVALALAASVVLVGGMDSCHYDYTEAYVIVTGSQYNQVASYLEQNETGRLFAAPGGPLSSGGSDPIRAVLLTGGRYVYVLNHGTPTMDSSGNISWGGQSIALFSIGGDGGLSYQQSYPSVGNGPVRIAVSSSGNFLYVLDSYEPSATGTATTTPGSASQSSTYPCYDSTNKVYRPVADISVFSIDPNTGRLFLVPNQQEQSPITHQDLSYFPLGCGVVDFHQASGYLYTVEASDPTNTASTGPAPSGNGEVVYPYQAQTTGQLIQAPGGSQVLSGTENVTVIGGSQSGSYIYVLDSGANLIYTYTAGGNGLLTGIASASEPNYSGTSGMSALTTDSNSRFLYITNTQSPALGFSNSVITAYTITPSSGVLQQLAESPYGVGSDPVCIFEDPSHQYMYTADGVSNEITGKAIEPQTGILGNLPKGSGFATVGTPTWCLYSSNTD